MSKPTRTISAQRYLDGKIVAAKRVARDYVAYRVQVTYEGETLYVMVDGHHSLSAARADGQPVVWEVPEAIQIEANGVCQVGDTAVGDWLAQLQGDAEWYDVNTGRDAW